MSYLKDLKELESLVSPNNLENVMDLIRNCIIKSNSKCHHEDDDIDGKINKIFERDALVYQGITYYTPDRKHVYSYDNKHVANINEGGCIQFTNKENYDKHNINKSIINTIVNKNNIVYISK